jgi:hypothetical protein
MPPKKAMVPGAALQPLDTNQDALSLQEARNPKKGRPPAQLFRRSKLIRKSGIYRPSISKCKVKRRRWIGWPIFRIRLTKPPKKCVILLKMTRTEGPSTGSFVRRAHLTKMNGAMTFIMVTLLLMMLLLW